MLRCPIPRWRPKGVALFSVLLLLVLLSGSALQAGLEDQKALENEAHPVHTHGRPLGELLKEDGMLDLTSGFRGSIDASGYRLVSAQGEAPRFVSLAARAGEEKWQPGFGPPGMNDYVYALAFDSAGNLYAGGNFITAGGVPASRIAKWDGSAWSALGTGMNNYVYALAVDSAGSLYAGGQFTGVGGVWASRIAKWDHRAWSTMGTGMNHYVSALAVDSAGNLYAGGAFTAAGDMTSYYIGLYGEPLSADFCWLCLPSRGGWRATLH